MKRSLRVLAPFVFIGGLAALGMLVGMLAVLLVRAQMVSVTGVVAGDARQTLTRAPTVGDLLDELEMVIGPYDQVIPGPDTPVTSDLVVRVEKARPVTLTVDGETSVFWTPLTNPAEILQNAGVDVTNNDRILVDGTRTEADELVVWPVPASHITVRRAVELHVIDGDQRQTVITTGETVGDALFDAGVTLYLADTVTPDLTTPLEDGMEVTVHRSRPVTIIADGETIETRTQGSLVGDALADAGVALVGLDYAIPSEDAELRPGMHIRVIRVQEETVTEETPLPFETVYQADPERELDQRAVIQEGREGRQETIVRVRYENGIEVERSSEETVVIEPPVNRVIAYGTKVVLRTIDTPEGPREYWRVLRLYATSYHPAALGGDDVTATGRRLEKGIVAVDRRIIPLGTQVFVPGYGIGLAADTAPPRNRGLWIDLGYSDHDYRHWARWVDVYVLTPVPPNIEYLLPQAPR